MFFLSKSLLAAHWKYFHDNLGVFCDETCFLCRASHFFLGLRWEKYVSYMLIFYRVLQTSILCLLPKSKAIATFLGMCRFLHWYLTYTFKENVFFMILCSLVLHHVGNWANCKITSSWQFPHTISKLRLIWGAKFLLYDQKNIATLNWVVEWSMIFVLVCSEYFIFNSIVGLLLHIWALLKWVY